MSHNQRIRPPGMWTPNGALLAAEVELLDQAQYLELHEGGGTWSIQSDVTIGAVGKATWNFTAPVTLKDFSGHVILGKTLTVDGDANLDLKGLLRVEPGALVRVLGQASLPGTVQVEQFGRLVITTGGYLTIGPGTGEVSGTLNILNGGLVDVQPGGVIKVESGGVIDLHGTAQQSAKIALADFSELDVGDNAMIQVAGGSIVLTSQGASFTKLMAQAGVGVAFSGPTIINDQATGGSNGTIFVGSFFGNGARHIQVGGGGDLSVANGGVANLNSQGTLNLNANCTVHFDGTAQLKGSPVFLDSLLLGQAAKAIFYQGSTFADGSVRTYTAPQIPSGPDAVNGIPQPIFGPTPTPGQVGNVVPVDTSGVVILDVPQNLSGDMGLSLKPPSHPEVSRLLFVRQRNPAVQGGAVGIIFNTLLLVAFTASTTDKAPGCAVLVWDTNAWTVVFAVGGQVQWPQ